MLLLKSWINFYRGCLISELRVSYELWVTIYCTSYELIFIYELRVTIYCTSYYELQVTSYCTSFKLIFTYKLRVTIYCTSYKLNLSYELRISIYCTSWGCNFDCVTLLFILTIHFYGSLFTKSSIPRPLFLSNVFHKWECQNVKLL